MALTQISTQGIKDGTITGTDLATNVDLVDDQKLRLGNSQNLQIYHEADGSSYITNSTSGHLIIKTINGGSDINLECNDDFFVRTASGTQNSIIARDYGQVELYYSGNKKFETSSSGAIISGILQVSNGSAAAPAIHFGDSDSGVYGDSSNGVRLTAGGSDTIVATTNGVTFPSSVAALTSLTLGSQSALSKPLYFADSASVQSASILLDNSSQELRIKNGRFAGKISFTTYNVERANIDNSGNFNIANDLGKIQLGASQDLQIYHDGTHSYIDNSTGVLFIRNTTATKSIYSRSDELLLQSYTGNENYIIAALNGSVDLYYDNSKKLETTGNGVAIGGATSVDQHLHIENSSGDAMIRLRGSTNYGVLFTKHSDASLTGYVGSGGAVNLGASNIGICASLAGGMIKFQTGGTSASNERVAINSSGMMTFDGGGSSYPWGGSFREDGGGSDNSVRLFFEGDNGVSNRTFSIMSENGKLRVSGGGTAGSATGTQLVYLASTSSTSWTSGSDIRLKENITEIPNVLDKIKNYRCARFNFKGDDASDIQNIKFGFIAQDWLTDFPEVISKSTQDADDPTDTTEYYGMQYTETIPVLLKAIQELVSKVEVLEAEVAALKGA